MKKLFAIAAIVLASFTTLAAQNTTRIGSESRLDYGIYFAYGSNLGWAASLVMDINSANNNFRTRLNLGDMQRWINPSVGVDVQYLFKCSDLFYIYPSVGAYSEFYLVPKPASKNWGAIGLEGGVGFEFELTSHFALFAQCDYQYMFNLDKHNRVVGKLGLITTF